MSHSTIAWMRQSFSYVELAPDVFKFERFSCPMVGVDNPPIYGAPLFAFYEPIYGSKKGEIAKGSRP